MQPTIAITFHDLKVLKPGDRARHPLAQLAPGQHLHGELRLRIQGRLVPHLGYYGPDDVCLNQWIQELAAIRKAFRGAPQGAYTFDEGEQGQPAFQFSRDGELILLSIVGSKIGDGQADPAWQEVAFSYRDFVQAYEQFKQALLAEIASQAPSMREQVARLFA